MLEHYTVLKEETVEGVINNLSGVYVDGTLGRGGHTQLLQEKLNKDALILAFDQDIEAIKKCEKKYENTNVKLIHSNFRYLANILQENKIEQINGIILDLGFSSPQIDNPERGFSYMQNGPLDMRMDLDNPKTAKEIVNTYSQKDLERILLKYGEENNASRIARKICEERNIQEIQTTFELVDVIESAIPMKIKMKQKGHNAKKTFQALRIEVNEELQVLDEILDTVFTKLAIGGRIGIISFHSLEDKIVKQKFKKWASVKDELQKIPVIPEEYLPKAKIITTKPILPSTKELAENSRSKSAKLRIMEKIR